MQQIQEVKCVKNSVFICYQDGSENIFECQHYGTTIFKATEYELLILNVPSVTSSKMAKRCYEYVFHQTPTQTQWKNLKQVHI